VNSTAIDALTQRVSGLSRRGSLLTLGGALVGAATRPRATNAAKSGKKCTKKCKQQRTQCRALTFDVCAGAADPAACQAFFLPSCDALGRCNADPLLQQVIVLR
jgi:hypothetical protein